MPLTASKIQATKPGLKPQRLFDSGGLYLEVSPAGSRLWRFKYRFGGKEKRLALGVYPETSLTDARGKRDAAHLLLASAIDPGEHRKIQKMVQIERMADRIVSGAVDWRLLKSGSVDNGTSRPLEILGIDEMEERAYGVLLSQHTVDSEKVGIALGLSSRKAQQLLDRLEGKGLATHSLERPKRYMAIPPELAVEALINQRQIALARARLTIPKLREQVTSAAPALEREQLVELITSRARLDQIYNHMRQTIQSEVIGLQRAPLIYSGGFQYEVPDGVCVRSISDEGYLALPGALNSLRISIEKGEEARIFRTLPIKMFMVDRRIGLIPLKSEDPGGPTLLVRSSALLDALYSLFELIWERSTPISFAQSGELEIVQTRSPMLQAAEQLIPLFAAGLNDKAIAHKAGISINTLTRRIAELMRRFDSHNRFQLGWRAALEAFTNGSSAKAADPPPHNG